MIKDLGFDFWKFEYMEEFWKVDFNGIETFSHDYPIDEIGEISKITDGVIWKLTLIHDKVEYFTDWEFVKDLDDAESDAMEFVENALLIDNSIKIVEDHNYNSYQLDDGHDWFLFSSDEAAETEMVEYYKNLSDQELLNAIGIDEVMAYARRSESITHLFESFCTVEHFSNCSDMHYTVNSLDSEYDFTIGYY